MTVGNNGYTQSGNSSSAAGFDKFLFPSDMDDLTQDYQTPGESGQAKWRFSDVYPVLKLSLNNSQGDGPSITIYHNDLTNDIFKAENLNNKTFIIDKDGSLTL